MSESATEEMPMNLLPVPPEEAPAPSRPVTPAAKTFPSLLWWLAVAIVIVGGTLVRVFPTAKVAGIGFDENLYRTYTMVLEKTGLLAYDSAATKYVSDQSQSNAQTELPPTRFLYICSGYIYKTLVYGDAKALNLREPGAFKRDPYLCSLRGVAKIFSVLAFILGGVLAWRLAGRAAGLSVLALAAVAPVQIHMSQHAMVDGFFSFWAMLSFWGLWEALHALSRRRWLAVYGLGLTAMVLTKENSFFVFVALCGLLVANRWTRWGVVSQPLLIVTFAAPALAVLALAFLGGGFTNLFQVYRLLVTNAQHLEYAIQTGDGPWYRYLIDLTIMSPVILCLAVAGALRGWKEGRWVGYALLFIVCSYALMCNVRYGMNLRYTTIWDMPLRLLAFAQLAWFARGAGSWSKYVLPALVAAVCLQEWHQYQVFFAKGGLYELAVPDLLHAIDIFK